MQFKRQVTYYITKIAPHLLTKWVYHFSFSRACFLWTLPVWQLNWPKKKPDQLAHVTVVDRVIYIGLMVSCLLSGIIWQSDKQTDRQTDKQSVGFWQRSHCQSHCHSVPLSSPTATGQYLSRQSASLPNIEQHAVAVFFFFQGIFGLTVSVFFFFFYFFFLDEYLSVISVSILSLFLK